MMAVDASSVEGPNEAATALYRETPLERAANHPNVALIAFQPEGGTKFTAAFTLPTGGQSLVLVLHGAGTLASPLVAKADGHGLSAQTMQMRAGWVAMIRLPPRRTWWTPLTCHIERTEAPDEPYWAKARFERPRHKTSLVEGDLLPARQADVRRPDDELARSEVVIRSIHEFLAQGEADQAARLVISAMALGLDDVRTRCGADVLEAIASHSEFFASAEALKLLIAMSS